MPSCVSRSSASNRSCAAATRSSGEFADLDRRNGHAAERKLASGLQQGAIEGAAPQATRKRDDPKNIVQLGAFHARLEVFAYRQHLLARQRLHDVPLETHNRHLAGPA